MDVLVMVVLAAVAVFALVNFLCHVDPQRDPVGDVAAVAKVDDVVTLETLRGVCEQRDRAFAAIDDIASRFWSAHYNHSFDSEDRCVTERNGTSEEYRCSAGRTLRSIFHGCDKFGTEECRGFDCPMGFHHRSLYASVCEASDIVNECPVEKKPYDPRRVPRYDPSASYAITAQWFARMMLMLLNGFRLGEKMEDGRSREVGSALVSLVSIGMSSMGMRFPFDILSPDKSGESDFSDDDPRVESFVGTLERFDKEYGDAIRTLSDMDADARDAALRLSDDRALAQLLMETFTLMVEFHFGHEYPSADLGVYSEFVGQLKHDCATVMGYESGFDATMDMNDERLDARGFEVSSALPPSAYGGEGN